MSSIKKHLGLYYCTVCELNCLRCVKIKKEWNSKPMAPAFYLQ